MKKNRSKLKINLQNEISNTKGNNISAEFKILSSQIEIPLHNLVKYSQIVQEEIKQNKIFIELNKSIQKVQIKHKSSINTFLQLLNDEDTEMNNEEFTDLLKLSEHFKVEILKNALKKYLQSHSKDIDFILSLKIEDENNIKENNIKEILTEDISEEMEECLQTNINECLKNDKINQISVSSIYRIIERSCKEQISNDLLCRFIIKSIKERHALFHFVEVEKLSEEVFEELIKSYSKFNTLENNKTYYFDFLPNQLNYIYNLKSKQKLLERQIQELEQTKENIIRENKQKDEKFEEIKKKKELQEKQIQELQQTNENIKKTNKQKEEEMKKINEQLETRHKEEIRQKDENIDKIEKEKVKITKENDQLKQIIKTKEEEIQQLNENQKSINGPFTGKIIEHLTKEAGGNVHDKGVVKVTAASEYYGHYAKYAVDIHNNSDYFASDDSFLKYDFIKRKVHPTSYLITTHNCHNPRNWVIEGSNNDNNWIILDTRQNETCLTGEWVTCMFDIKSHDKSYRYLRIRRTGKNSDNSYLLCFSSLDFIGTLS